METTAQWLVHYAIPVFCLWQWSLGGDVAWLWGSIYKGLTMSDVEIINELLEGSSHFKCNSVDVSKWSIEVKINSIMSVDITKELTDWLNRFDRPYYIDSNFRLSIKRNDFKKL